MLDSVSRPVADIYSLGAMAYELLTGDVVFPNRTPQRMLVAHLSEAPRPVTELRPDTLAAAADLSDVERGESQYGKNAADLTSSYPPGSVDATQQDQ